MRIVLDTNVVLDLIVFHDPGATDLKAAIDSGQITLLTSPDCLVELRRVLAYVAFGLDQAAQESAFAWFRDRVHVSDAPPSEPLLPRCRDRDDQKFLDLAWESNADYLVTKDKALLELARRVARLGRFLVSSPTELPLGSR